MNFARRTDTDALVHARAMYEIPKSARPDLVCSGEDEQGRQCLQHSWVKLSSLKKPHFAAHHIDGCSEKHVTNSVDDQGRVRGYEDLYWAPNEGEAVIEIRVDRPTNDSMSTNEDISANRTPRMKTAQRGEGDPSRKRSKETHNLRMFLKGLLSRSIPRDQTMRHDGQLGRVRDFTANTATTIKIPTDHTIYLYGKVTHVGIRSVVTFIDMGDYAVMVDNDELGKVEELLGAPISDLGGMYVIAKGTRDMSDRVRLVDYEIAARTGY